MRSFLTHAACVMAGAAAGALAAYAAASARQPCSASWAYPPGCTALVRKVVDGDTLVLADGMHVRYLGINAPEMGRFVRDPAPFAEQAAERNSSLVAGKSVRLVPGPNPLDVHGRLLADVYVVDEKSGREVWVQEILVSEGMARASFGPSAVPAETVDRLAAAEASAKERKAGIWGCAEAAAFSAEEFPYCGGSGDVYHRRTCPHALRMNPMNMRFYRTEDEAAAAGRRPCRACIPQQPRGR